MVFRKKEEHDSHADQKHEHMLKILSHSLIKGAARTDVPTGSKNGEKGLGSKRAKALNCKWRRSCPGWGVTISPLNEAVCISIEFPLLYKEVPERAQRPGSLKTRGLQGRTELLWFVTEGQFPPPRKTRRGEGPKATACFLTSWQGTDSFPTGPRDTASPRL